MDRRKKIILAVLVILTLSLLGFYFLLCSGNPDRLCIPEDSPGWFPVNRSGFQVQGYPNSQCFKDQTTNITTGEIGDAALERDIRDAVSQVRSNPFSRLDFEQKMFVHIRASVRGVWSTYEVSLGNSGATISFLGDSIAPVGIVFGLITRELRLALTRLMQTGNHPEEEALLKIKFCMILLNHLCINYPCDLFDSLMRKSGAKDIHELPRLLPTVSLEDVFAECKNWYLENWPYFKVVFDHPEIPQWHPELAMDKISKNASKRIWKYRGI